jgi:hypothetical protein
MRKWIGMILALAAVAPAGCETKGPAERAGESIDRGIRNVRDAVDPPSPTEKVGRAFDRVINR